MIERHSHAWLLTALIGIAIITAPSAKGWIRYYAPDDELVSRSDSIVVGHLVGTIQEVPFDSEKLPDGRNFEYTVYRARLLVSAVIAGHQPVGETTLIIHYGLRPAVLTPHPTFIEQLNPKAVDASDSTSPVGIYDSATTALGGPPSDNLRQDHLWFLRKNCSGPSGRQEPTDAPGIASPDDIESLSEQGYYEAITRGSSEGLQEFVDRQQWRLNRIKTAQGRLKVREVCRNPDLSARCDQLISIWRREQWSPVGTLALEQIFKCGLLGEEKLVPLFREPEPIDIRAILQGWSSHDFPGMSAALIPYLDRQREWWKTRSLAQKSFAALDGSAAGPQGDDPLGISFRNLYCAVEWLQNSRDPRVRPAVLAIRDQWKNVPFKTQNNLLTVCDETLATLH